MSALLILAATIFGFVSASADPEKSERFFSDVLEGFATNFGWFYILTTNALLMAVAVLTLALLVMTFCLFNALQRERKG